MIGSDIVDRLLGVPPGPVWRTADQARRSRILETWLSSAVARDLPVGPAAREHLDRHRRRVESLHGLGEDLAARHGLRVIKGPRIARYYPPELLRQSGDVDLVAPDQYSLWQCVLDLGERVGAVPQNVSLLQNGSSLHVGVALKWPAEEELLDKPLGADITTCAFSGDLAGVPVRAAAPGPDDLCGLFAVAEELFQRKCRTKDLLDLLVLTEVLERRLGETLIGTVCRYADSLALAPELRKLLVKADEWVPVSPLWHRILEALEPVAREERARRAPDRPGMHRLRFGYPLDARASADLAVTVLRRADGDVATTPVGTCLLTDGLVLREDTLAAAVDYARTLTAVG